MHRKSWKSRKGKGVNLQRHLGSQVGIIVIDTDKTCLKSDLNTDLMSCSMVVLEKHLYDYENALTLLLE